MNSLAIHSPFTSGSYPFAGYADQGAHKSASTNVFEAYRPAETPMSAPRATSNPEQNTAAWRSSPSTDSPKPGYRRLTVGPGGTLWNIAGNYDVVGATRYQKMAAIFNANRHAFLNNEMSKLKAGAQLVLPDAATVRGIDAKEAQALCAKHINNYEHRRHGTTPDAPRAELKPGDSVVVTHGQKLGDIAGKYQVPNATLWQKLTAIFNANPDAFIGNNMHRMKTGVNLILPNAQDVVAISADAAERLVKKQWAELKGSST